jgi:hypothetical protein
VKLIRWGADRSRISRNKGPGWRSIQSWLGVFRANAYAQVPTGLEQLSRLVQNGPYYCVGQAHSYNGIQVNPNVTAIMMAEGNLKTMHYSADRGTVLVGASVCIDELKTYLLKFDRRLVNSGNYMRQTVVGALATGTHGYGDSAVMADGIVALTFLDGAGLPVMLRRRDADFPLVALSFGVIAPIVELELETLPLASFQSDAWITRLSRKAGLVEGAEAVTMAALPYSDPEDPTIVLHTLRAPPEHPVQPRRMSPLFTLRGIVERIIAHYQAFDRLLPFLRRPLQRLAAKLDLQHHRQVITDERDLDFLYDPAPLLASERAPDLLQGLFSTTHTAYNLAFFVPMDQAETVLRFIMLEVDSLRNLGFYLKSLIGMRELRGSSPLPFAGNFNGPVVAFDLFTDPRDYAWLERLQNEVLAYYPNVRPHWGKSAIVEAFRPALGDGALRRLGELHRRHYPQRTLVLNERVRRLLGFAEPLPGTSQGEALRQDTVRGTSSRH